MEKKIRVVKIVVSHPYLGLPRTFKFSEIEFNLENLEAIEAIALKEVVQETGYMEKDFKVEVLQETD